MVTTLYIYQKDLDSNLIELFESLYTESTIHFYTEEFFALQTTELLDEPVDYHEIYTLVLNDFSTPITLLILTSMQAYDGFNHIITENLKYIPPKEYTIETFILSLIKRKPEVVPTLQKSLTKMLGHELIDTTLAIAEANMNFSIAAKNHYLHRNTLQYRIDKIYEKSGIDIKTFYGLSIFTLLFKN